MQSVRQVHLWLRHERIPLPAVTYGAEGRVIEWKLPVYNTILHILTNPTYAGAYAFGRTGSRVSIEAGRKKVVRGFKKERKDWEVLISNHHEGYLSWADYERNLRLIADNANGKNPMSRGALRRGEALLAGLLRCGHCGRKLHVAYSGKDGNTGRYHCQGGFINHGSDRCISFGGLRIDREVGTEVIERLQPLGIEAALLAQAVRSRASEDKQRQVELALEQARYEVGRARRQYVRCRRVGEAMGRAAGHRPQSGDRAGRADGLARNRTDADRSRAADDTRRGSTAGLGQAGCDAGGQEADRANTD
jgi:hypothetical protein